MAGDPGRGTPGVEVGAEAYDRATAIALRAADGAELDLEAGDADAGTTAASLDETFDGSPGYAAETLTLDLINAFLYVISALVVGAFFTVWTIQRKHEIAVARAMGASTSYLVRDALGQAAVLLAASTLAGFAVGIGFGTFLTSTPMPFALEAAPLALAAALLVGLGLIGAAASVGRIARIDPITALGGHR